MGPGLPWAAAAGPTGGPAPAVPAAVANGPAAGPGADEPASEDLVIDVEPFSGESHEKVLQGRRDHAESADPDPRRDEFGADPLWLFPGELRGHLAACY